MVRFKLFLQIMEYSSMSERILRSIENIINSDPLLQDFTIIPTEDNTRNKSPVLYEEHHLGLESWCMKYVYQYVCSQLFKVRKSLAEKKMSYSKRESLNYLILGGLFINPDVTTFWNMRRELVESDVLNNEQELRFSKLVLTRKNKCNVAFVYRRWILSRILEKMSKNNVVPPVTILEAELELCSLTAINSQNNYHSWTYRIWCMEHFAPYFPDLVTRELEFSERWIGEHVSENTGYHYRQFLLDRFKNGENLPDLPQYFNRVARQLNILNDGEPSQILVFLLGKSVRNRSIEDLPQQINYLVLLLYELLVVIESINKTYIEHESLWLHRRYVLYSLLLISHEYLGENFSTAKKIEFHSSSSSKSTNCNKNMINIIINDNYGEKQPKIFKSQPNKFGSSNLFKILCKSEKQFISKNSVGSMFQIDLAKRYEKWLRYILGFELS